MEWFERHFQFELNLQSRQHWAKQNISFTIFNSSKIIWNEISIRFHGRNEDENLLLIYETSTECRAHSMKKQCERFLNLKKLECHRSCLLSFKWYTFISIPNKKILNLNSAFFIYILKWTAFFDALDVPSFYFIRKSSCFVIYCIELVIDSTFYVCGSV